MKNILFGISMLLSGIMCLIISWMGDIRVIDIIGIILGAIGFIFALFGFLKKDK